MNKFTKDWEVESEFTHEGLQCVVIMTEMGHRCGYVAIPEGHALHGVEYNDDVKGSLKDINCEELGYDKLSPIDIFLEAGNQSKGKTCISSLFNIHGGITYSRGREGYPIESEDKSLFWWGFDSAHYNDDVAIGGKPLDYMQSECRNLAEMISNLNDSIVILKEIEGN